MIDRESRAADLDAFALGGLVIPQPPQPVSKPLDVDVARAAANNLIVNVVNLNYEIREIVAAQGIQFHNADTEKQIALDGQSIPQCLARTRPKNDSDQFAERFSGQHERLRRDHHPGRQARSVYQPRATG